MNAKQRNARRWMREFALLAAERIKHGRAALKCGSTSAEWWLVNAGLLVAKAKQFRWEAMLAESEGNDER